MKSFGLKFKLNSLYFFFFFFFILMNDVFFFFFGKELTNLDFCLSTLEKIEVLENVYLEMI